MHVMSGMWSRMEERIGGTCLEGREFKENIISIMCLTLTKIWLKHFILNISKLKYL